MEKPKPHAHKLRVGRYSEPGRIYLLTTVTQGRKRLFDDLYVGRELVKLMRQHHERGQIDSLAYVIMPDHIHWLVALGDRSSLPGLMRSFKGFSAKALSRTFSWIHPPVWQRGYHDHAVRRFEDVKALARYVVANPLRAGLADNMGDYPLWDAIWL